MSQRPAAYSIGDRVWFRGDCYRVTSEPFEDFGTQWQRAVGVENGREIVVPTPASVAESRELRRAAEAEMRAGFRRLARAKR